MSGRQSHFGATGSPVALLGAGAVGQALLARWPRLAICAPLSLVYVANSREAITLPLAAPAEGVFERFRAEAKPDVRVALSDLGSIIGPCGTIIDATGSVEVADWHGRWLAQGLGIVTANKAAIGGDLGEYRFIAARADRYGDSATVGAGLPLLSSLRSLRAGGDRVHAIAGALSGTLAWLLDRYDGRQAFSSLLAEATRLGYCEPDPRLDLSGSDVRRKLLILARAAGADLDAEEVIVESLVPPRLVPGTWQDAKHRLADLDEVMQARWRAARAEGKKLRYVARWSVDGGARIGLELLAPGDALLGGQGCDNRVAIWSCRYRSQPLIVQGPGAGPDVTAAALGDDLLRLALQGNRAVSRTAA